VTAEEMDAMLNQAFTEYDMDQSGYINSAELSGLCAQLNTPLNPSEANQALRQLDRDGSGKIELFEFKNWWLGKIVFTDKSIGGKLNDAASEGKSRLLKAKLARKQAEADAQLLANRIALLQQEEAKAWKKIQQTKIRATEILSLREENEKRQQTRAEYQFKEGEYSRRAQEQRFYSKQKDKAMRQKTQNEIIKKRQYEVKSIRRQRRENEIEKQRQKQADQERARYNREVVRAHEDKLRKDKSKKEEDLRAQNENEYKRRVNSETDKTHEKEIEVSAMEQQEIELIQRLQNAQMLQKEAYEQLENALSGAAVKAQ